MFLFFFFNDTATTEIYTLSLHDALPICARDTGTHAHDGNKTESRKTIQEDRQSGNRRLGSRPAPARRRAGRRRSEEHTSELQSLAYLVCRLLLEKKKKNNSKHHKA